MIAHTPQFRGCGTMTGKPSIGAILLIVLLVVPARAGFKSGNKFLEECSSKQNVDWGVCMGYVEGIADEISGQTEFTAITSLDGKKTKIYRPRACIRSEVTASQIRDIALKWVTDHPETRDWDANALVSTALAAAFPC